MLRVFTLPLYAGVAFLVYQIVSLILQYRRQAIKARELGCKRPPSIPCADPFGIQLARLLIKADNEKRMTQYQVDRAEEMSVREGRLCHTYSVKIPPGRTNFVTSEPENVKAILATQFKDFGLPNLRILDFIPMLGRGIVSLINFYDVELLLMLITVRIQRRAMGTFESFAQTSIHPRTSQRSRPRRAPRTKHDEGSTNRRGWLDPKHRHAGSLLSAHNGFGNRVLIRRKCR